MQIAKAPENKDTIIRHVARQYHALSYLPQLQELFTLIHPLEDCRPLAKFELHERINAHLLKQYHGEQAIKYALFKSFKQKQVVAAFEINVSNSRLDFLTVNGVTTGYEIKSSLDTLQKLPKQSADYLKAFEYNNIVIDERHLINAKQIVPEHYGIITIHRGRKKMIQQGSYNNDIDAEFQLSLLTKKELNSFFRCRNVKDILREIDPVSINIKFKQALKARYKERWNFITRRADEILPLDIQFFFNSNVEPSNIYR
ncbi:MAG: sce7726 family protein [Sphingobacteriales bacterium]